MLLKFGFTTGFRGSLKTGAIAGDCAVSLPVIFAGHSGVIFLSNGTCVVKIWDTLPGLSGAAGAELSRLCHVVVLPIACASLLIVRGIISTVDGSDQLSSLAPFAPAPRIYNGMIMF